MSGADIIVMLSLAAAIDIVFGEPPSPLHPVVWMGKCISWLEKGNRAKSPALQFIYGGIITLILTALFTTAAIVMLIYARELHHGLYIIAGALLLKTMFSFRGLLTAAARVRDALRADDLHRARRDAGAIVSRDTISLDESGVASAAVESVAEGLCDSLVAPLFYFLLFGVPGAVAYRVVNTLDAMTGYHGKYEHYGKFSARLDDILNYIPARLAALALVVAAVTSRKNPGHAVRAYFNERKKTSSPNAGCTIAVAAGALGVVLEKPGHYRVGSGQNKPNAGSISAVIRLAVGAFSVFMLLGLSVGGLAIVFD